MDDPSHTNPSADEDAALFEAGNELVIAAERALRRGNLPLPARKAWLQVVRAVEVAQSKHRTYPTELTPDGGGPMPLPVPYSASLEKVFRRWMPDRHYWEVVDALGEIHSKRQERLGRPGMAYPEQLKVGHLAAVEWGQVFNEGRAGPFAMKSWETAMRELEIQMPRGPYYTLPWPMLPRDHKERPVPLDEELGFGPPNANLPPGFSPAEADQYIRDVARSVVAQLSPLLPLSGRPSEAVREEPSIGLGLPGLG